MKCTKPRFDNPIKECEFDHPCPFHDLVVDFNNIPPSVSIPMDNADKINACLDRIIIVAIHEAKKYGIKKVIFSDIKINKDNTKFEGNTVLLPNE